MKSAIQRAAEAGKTHIDVHPGHEVLLADGTDHKGKWASWTCVTCKDADRISTTSLIGRPIGEVT
jgi:hypothetical protein